MELRHLRYFRAVAESKGFREAARRLHVVQPALSQTVSDLERELGVRLLTRNSRSVRLTSEGEVALPWGSAHTARDGASASDRRVPRRTTGRRVHSVPGFDPSAYTAIH